MKQYNTLRAVAADSIFSQSREICALYERLSTCGEFLKAISILANRGENSRVIITGIGKSGHVGRKMAATLASTGTTSFFVHSTEAFHGDLGMFGPTDVIIMISNSGETDEVIKLLPTLRRWGNKVISISGNPASTLATHADANIDVRVSQEVCPNNLAPTTSTTATIVVGDALACALIKANNFEATDFAEFHPGGSLGRRLLSKVKDFKKKRNHLAIVNKDTSYIDVVLTMTSRQCGVAIVLGDKDELLGVISDGDLRRAVVNNINTDEAVIPISTKASDIMTSDFIAVDEDTSLVEATDIMKDNRIKQLVIVDKHNNFVSIVEQHDVI